jgi:succinate-acetate transporter protein
LQIGVLGQHSGVAHVAHTPERPHGEADLGRMGLATAGEDAAWDALRQRITISLRPLGAVTALGFLGLAAATSVLASMQLGWVPASDGRRVAIVLVGFAFVAQLLAAVFSFLSRDGGAGTAMGQLALVWLVVGASMLSLPPGSKSDGLGVFLVFAGVSLLLTAGVTALSKLVPAAIFTLAALRFLTTGTFELGAGEGWENVSGLLGLALAALAIYAALAAQLEEALGKAVLPLGRRGRAKVALEGSLLEQVKHAPNEPGVRTML